MYILTKAYDGVNDLSSNFTVSEEVKLNTSGVIWMRLKNHPIAFPMLYKSFNTDTQVEKIS